jgi:CubicO group peptidase (beta-lactamase class C family)
MTATTYWPTHGWRRSTPEEQGIDPTLLAQAAHEARDNMPTLYSLLIIRNGYLVFEEHYRGHKPSDLYSVRSVTKSVTSALVGIAGQSDYLSGLEQKVAELLPEYFSSGRTRLELHYPPAGGYLHRDRA